MSRQSTNRLFRIPVFFALQKSTVGLLIMVILVDMGERMGERFLPIYLMALGGGALSIGLPGGHGQFVVRALLIPWRVPGRPPGRQESPGDLQPGRHDRLQHCDHRVFLDRNGKERRDLRVVDYLQPAQFLGRMAELKGPGS